MSETIGSCRLHCSCLILLKWEQSFVLREDLTENTSLAFHFERVYQQSDVFVVVTRANPAPRP